MIPIMPHRSIIHNVRSILKREIVVQAISHKMEERIAVGKISGSKIDWIERILGTDRYRLIGSYIGKDGSKSSLGVEKVLKFVWK